MQDGCLPRRDLTRTTLAVLFVCALILFTGWIVLPFLTASLWATTIVISTWPMLRSVQSKVGGRRGIATLVMTVVLLAVVFIPLGLAAGALIGSMDKIATKVKALETVQLPPPPDWLGRIPIRGPKLAGEWRRLSAEGPGSLAAAVAPYSGLALRWFAARVGGIGGMIVQFLLAVILSAILYMHGETAARGVRRFATRLAGVNGERAAVLAASTIRAVAMGVIVTALVQTAIAGAGLAAVSMPGAGLLAAAVLMLCVAQLGPVLVMAPAVIWKFHSGDSAGGFILLAFAVVACTIDNFLRPLLIRRGASLPLLIIFAGVIGGMISFGVMGIFVGPATLAVAWVLVREWVDMQPQAEEEAAAGARSTTAPG
jgi:predicted PurR-regulated permease PerM